ncbi:hypothetical protein [Nocardia sp. NPDC048505]|uniref:hypothetical protein n=1 Tax=unclassified Nocardia TaxID=2637762 RepID=UPI0034119DB7
MTDSQNADNAVVFDDAVMITMRGVSDSVGLPYTVNPMQLLDREVLIELREGPAGPSGAAGETSWPWRWQGDIANPAALADLRSTADDAGKAWRVVSENAIYFWTGMEFIAFRDAFGQVGRPGTPNVLTGSGVSLPADAQATARMIGAAPNQQLEIGFPRGVPGPIGDPGQAGAIRDAADVRIANDRELGRDYILAWDATLSAFRPTPSPRLGGPWAIASAQFAGGSNITQASRALATITIPAQPLDWRPAVQGSIRVSGSDLARCDIEVRLGAPDGPMVGHGFGRASTNDQLVLIGPKFEYPLSPQSRIGVVPTNQTTTLYVLARRVFGTGAYTIRTDGAQLVVYAQPV